jgi:SAM-dependent methyltransferase
MGLRRAERIRSLLPASAPAPRILDIGCAYGPFLDASRSLGFLGFGLDPSEDAVRYVGGELKIPALRGSFPEADLESAFGKELFDAISLWYVIEHMTDVGAALRKVYDLLRPGGVLAFSTPSFAGISARTGERRFLDKSPQDHWTVWDPRITGRLLAGFGFSLKKTVSTGHHPERFPLPGHLIPSQGNGWGYKMLKRVSESGSLGDTFEAYAVKMEDSDRHA